MMLNCNSCSKLIPDDSEFCPFCGNKIIHKTETFSENSEQLHLYQPEALLKRAFLLLEEGLFDKADAYLEVVLNQDPENAEAYLGKLMVDLRVETQEELKDCSLPFDNKGSYRMIMRFGDESLKTTLIGYIESINARNEEAKIDDIYRRAIDAMKSATTENEYRSVAELFESISAYMDSESLMVECIQRAEDMKIKKEYEQQQAKIEQEEKERLANRTMNIYFAVLMTIVVAIGITLFVLGVVIS